MVNCQACGRTHVHEGTLAVSHQAGEVQLNEQQFMLSQIRALAPVPVLETSEAASISGWAFRLLWQVVLLLAALSGYLMLVKR